MPILPKSAGDDVPVPLVRPVRVVPLVLDFHSYAFCAQTWYPYAPYYPYYSPGYVTYGSYYSTTRHIQNKVFRIEDVT